MREQFDKTLSEISGYSKARANRMLDDMGTAYISSFEDNQHLDTSLMYVRTAKKYLRSKGFTIAEIDDYMLEKSYISKTDLNKLRNQCIDDIVYSKAIVDTRPMLHDERLQTDIIIDGLKSRPELLNCLKNGESRQMIEYKFKIHNVTLLKTFYDKHKSIID